MLITNVFLGVLVFDRLHAMIFYLELSQGIQKHYIDNLKFVKLRPRVNRGRFCPPSMFTGKLRINYPVLNQPRLGVTLDLCDSIGQAWEEGILEVFRPESL